MPPSAARLAGIGLAIAAATILALAGAILLELEREVSLHRDVIGGQLVKDSLETLRTQLNELRFAARLAAQEPAPDALQMIERRAVEVDAELGYLGEQPAGDASPEAFEELSRAARLLAANARSIAAARRSRGPSVPLAVEQTERVAADAMIALERSLEAQSRRINDRTLEQIRVSETLRTYVSWLLGGSIAILVGLYAAYRRAKSREQEALVRIERLAHFDALTGLPNRSLLADRIDREIARARRNERGFALLLYDLDGFKEVNDTWGHAAGDRVLAMVAERSRRCMRASDTVGRQGGDEFLAILPETSREGALAVAEKLRESLREPYEMGRWTARLGASVGVSFFPEHGDTADELQIAADAALYTAKREGKNRTAVAPAPRDARAATA